MEDLKEKMKKFFREEGSIAYSIYQEQANNINFSLDEIKEYYKLIKSGSPLSEGIYRECHRACCLYYLAKAEPEYINNIKVEVIGKLNKNTDKINDENLQKAFNTAHFLKDFSQELKQGTSYINSYLIRFLKAKKNYENYILYYLYSGALDLFLGEYKTAEKSLRFTLDNLCEKQEKLKERPYLVTYRNIAVDLFKNLLREISTEENKRLKLEGINKFAVNSYFSLPILEVIIEDTKKKSDPTSKENVEIILAVASRIGYIGILLNEKKIIEESINEMTNAMKYTEGWKNALSEASNKKEELEDISAEDQKKLTIHYAYNFILSIISITSKDPKLNTIAQDFRNNFLPFLDKDDEKNFTINKDNKNDLILNLSNIITEDKDLRAYIKKISAEEIIKEFQNNKIDDNKVLSFIFTIHSEINKLSEECYLEKNPNTKGEYEAKIICYGKSVLEFISKQDKKQCVINKPLVLSAIIEIYSSIFHIFYKKKDQSGIQFYRKIFEGIKENFAFDEKIPSYGLIFKIEGDSFYLFGDFENAQKMYLKAIDKGYTLPIVHFSIGLMFYLMNKPSDALLWLKKSDELLKNTNLNKFPNNSKARNEMISAQYQMVKKLVKAIEDLLKDKSSII